MKVAALALLLSVLAAPGQAQEPSPSPGSERSPPAPEEPSAEATPAPAAPEDPDRARVAGSEVPAPKRTKLVRPEYPPEAAARGARGIVILELLIDVEGKVERAEVTRPVAGAPELDEAALRAVRQWEYEATKVDGRPVRVRLTVPITFALRLPELARQEGIPELRQGVAPQIPAGETAPSRPQQAVAEVTLDAQGQVIEAEIVKGDPPWTEALLQAIRTWRFAPDPDGAEVSFRIEAEFAAVRGESAPRVQLQAAGLRRSGGGVAEGAPEAPVPTAPAAPAPPTGSEAPAGPAGPASPGPSPAPTPAPGPVGPETTGGSPAPSPTPASASPAPSDAPGTPSTPSSGSPAPSGPPPPPSSGTPPRPPTQEVIPGTPPPPSAPEPPPPSNEPGVSAVRDVVLGPGVPDLVKGLRPAPPPLARMEGASGTVEVEFSVDAAGGSAVRSATGPDVLRPAAEHMVSSWTFRRTTAERLFLLARISFEPEGAAKAEVSLAP